MAVGIALALTLGAAVSRAQSQTYYDLRVGVLSAIFPGTQAASLGRKKNSALKILDRWNLVFPDALADDAIYAVTGKPAGALERCAAQDLLTHKALEARQVRLQLFQWPGNARDLVAIVQYRFDGARPSEECTSIGLLFRLHRAAKTWEAAERFVFDARRHHLLNSIAIGDWSGDGRKELAVESDSGDVERMESRLHVFDLSRGYFFETLNVPTRMKIAVRAEQWTQTLDIARTLDQHGEQFCFEKTVYAAGLRMLTPPEVTEPCYPRGEGVPPRAASAMKPPLCLQAQDGEPDLKAANPDRLAPSGAPIGCNSRCKVVNQKDIVPERN